MALITRTCPCYAAPTKRKLKVSSTLSVCVLSARNQYRKTHDKLGKKVHWLLCKKFQIECKDKWFSHQPELVLENDKCKILWDLAIQTEKEIEHRRSGIVVIDKEKRECKIIDIYVRGDRNIKVKELPIIPILVGALGAVSEELKNHLKIIVIPIVLSCLQKAALLGTASILRRILDISESG